MRIRRALATLVSVSTVALGGVIVAGTPARAAACGLGHINSSGGDLRYHYNCSARSISGTLKDTKADGKCAYKHIWAGGFENSTTRVCGAGKSGAFKIYGGDYDTEQAHIVLEVR
jgi:hypothetical protein